MDTRAFSPFVAVSIVLKFPVKPLAFVKSCSCRHIDAFIIALDVCRRNFVLRNRHITVTFGIILAYNPIEPFFATHSYAHVFPDRIVRTVADASE